jgi:hypothetical protein
MEEIHDLCGVSVPNDSAIEHRLPVVFPGKARIGLTFCHRNIMMFNDVKDFQEA